MYLGHLNVQISTVFESLWSELEMEVQMRKPKNIKELEMSLNLSNVCFLDGI